LVNDKHLEILRKGVAFWNSWREENPSFEPDLSAAILNGEILGGVNFYRTNLSKTNLADAILALRLMWIRSGFVMLSVRYSLKTP
jgi:hypothetical protein